MNSKLRLCLALILSGVFIDSLCSADDTNKIIDKEKTVGVDNVHTVVIKMPGLKDTVFFTEQPMLFTVQMVVASYPAGEKHATSKVSELHRQVWLLRADGSSITQIQKPDVIGVGSGGYAEYHLIFTFQKKATNEIAGIVVSVNGKLYCQKPEKT